MWMFGVIEPTELLQKSFSTNTDCYLICHVFVSI